MRERGSYTLVFDLDDYFGKLGYSSLNSAVSIRFNVVSVTQRHDLSLLITPASCIAYRETGLPFRRPPVPASEHDSHESRAKEKEYGSHLS
jgi:hypothetical protein